MDPSTTIEDIYADLIGVVVEYLDELNEVITFVTSTHTLTWKAAQSVTPWEASGTFGRRVWLIESDAEFALLLTRNEFLSDVSPLTDRNWCFHLTVNDVITDATVVSRLAKLTFCTSLTLCDAEEISDMSLQAIGASLARLQLLNVANCVKLTDDGVAAVAKLPLVSLNLGSCEQVSDSAMKSLAHNHTLRDLQLQWCKMITDVGAASIWTMRSLQSLSLQGCSGIASEGFQGIEVLRNSLASLSLWGMGLLDDSAIAHISKVTSLTSLDLSWCKGLSDMSAAHIARGLKNLKFLDVQGCALLSNTACALIATLHIEILDVSCCQEISDEGLRHLASMVTLKCVSLAYLPRVTDAAKAAIRCLKNPTDS